MSFFQNGSIVQQLTSTATSGGTTALTASSKQYQIFTGTSSHTVQLPNATTMKNGMVFTIVNDSTGTLTINYSDSSLATTIEAGLSKEFVLFDNGTANGSFDISVNSSGGGGASQADLNLLRSAQTASSSVTSYPLIVNPEEIGADVWVSKKGIPAVCAWGAGSSLNGYFYAMGGLDSAVIVATVARFDLDNNYWLSRGSLNTAIIDQAAATSPGGFIYSIAGDTGSVTAAVEKYNDSTNTWSVVTSIPAASQEIRAFALKDIYAFGGSNPANAAANSLNYIYVEANNAWYTRTPTITASAAPGVFTLNSLGYKCGGNSSGNASGSYLSSAERYNEVNDAWASISALSGVKAYTGNGDTNANGFGYVTGGKTPSDTAVVERYSDLNGVWTSKNALSSTKEGMASGVVNHNLIVASGYNGSYLTTVDAYSSANLYKANIVKRLASVPTSLFVSAKIAGLTYSLPAQVRTDGDNWKNLTTNIYASALKTGEVLATKFLESGLVYVAGGSAGPAGYTSYASSESYNPISNAWTNRASMNTARAACFGFAVGGAGYVTGGAGPSLLTHLTLTSTEKYDEIVNAFTSKTAMPAGASSGIGMAILGYGYAWGGGPFGDVLGTTPTANYQYNATLDSWATKTVIPAPFAQQAGWTLFECGYMTSGSIDTSSSTQAIGYAYNPVSDTWVAIANAPNADRQVHGFASGGYGYRAGGVSVSSTATHKYDPGTNTWSTVTSLNTNGTNGAGLASAGVGYSVNNDSLSTRAEKYNIASNTWTSIGATSVGRRQASSNFTPGVYRDVELRIGIPAFIAGTGAVVWTSKNALVSAKSGPSHFQLNGTIYVAGGYNGAVDTADGQKYNKETDSWSAYSSMTTTRNNDNGASLGGFGYTVAGQITAGGATDNTADKLNDVTNVFSLTSNLSTSRVQCGVFALNGYLYAAGNSSANSATEQYNQSTNVWANKAALNTQSGEMAKCSLNGFGYIAGGVNPGVINTTQKYNDANDAWITVANMTVARQDAASFVLSGLFWAAGNGSGTTNTVEAYSDVTNIWYSKPSSIASTYNSGGVALDNAGYKLAGYAGGVTTNVEQLTPTLNRTVLDVAIDIS